MGKNEYEILPDNEDELEEINFYNKDKAMACFKNANDTILKIKNWKEEYKTTNDGKKEEAIKGKISLALETVSAEITRANNLIGLMRKDVDDKKKMMDDPNCQDAKLRILNTITGVLQQKIFFLVKGFNKIQLEIKDTYKQKMSRQLMAYDPDLDEDAMNELVNDPAVSLLENGRVYQPKGL